MALSSYEFQMAYINFLCFHLLCHFDVTLSWVHTEPWGGTRGFPRWRFNLQNFGDLFQPLPPCTSEALSSFNGFNLTSAHFQVVKFWISSWNTSRPPFPSAPSSVPQKWVVLQERQGGPARHSSSGSDVASRRLAWKTQKSLCHWHFFPSLTSVPTHIPNFATGRKGQIPLERLLERKVEGALLRSQNLLRDLLVLWQLPKSPGTVLGHPVWTRSGWGAGLLQCS